MNRYMGIAGVLNQLTEHRGFDALLELLRIVDLIVEENQQIE